MKIKLINKSGIVFSGLSVLSLSAPCMINASEHKKAEKPNVLFICIDDLRRDLGCLGSQAVSPNIDHLAAYSHLFCNQYVSAPTSGASRYGLLTSNLPVERADIGNDASEIKIARHPETAHPETMFHQLRRNGYYTVGIGKVSHSADGYVYPYTSPKSDVLELPHSWDEMLFNPGKWKTGWNAFFAFSDGENRQSMKNNVKPYECGPVNDKGLPDGLTADLAVKKLKELSRKKEPFCLAVGFFKPHLPFVSPQKYWKMYDEDTLAISPVADIPQGMGIGLHNSGEFKSYKAGDEMPSTKVRVSDDYARKLRHAYYACVSYTDAQVGKVLKALKKTGLDKNTIVVLWGDHGWHLGDYRVWGKHTIYETSVASPLIIHLPGQEDGVRHTRIVSSMDIYPTLMELCGVEIPEGLDGKSMTCLLNDTESEEWVDRAYSFYNAGVSVRLPHSRVTYYMRNGGPKINYFRYDDHLQMELKDYYLDDKEEADSLVELYLTDHIKNLPAIFPPKSSGK